MDPRIAAVIKKSANARWLGDHGCEVTEYLDSAIVWMKVYASQKDGIAHASQKDREERQDRTKRRLQRGQKRDQRLARKLDAVRNEVVARFAPVGLRLEPVDQKLAEFVDSSRWLSDAARKREYRTEGSIRRVALSARLLLLAHIHEVTGDWPYRRVFDIFEECAAAVDLDLFAIGFSEESLRQESWRLRTGGVAQPVRHRAQRVTKPRRKKALSRN
jgi:hypothetical protein